MRFLLILLLFPLLAFAQEYEFQQEWDTIPIEFEGYQLPYPWMGGLAYTMPALVDIDADSLFELILCNLEGGLFYFENSGTPQEPDFYLEEEEWQGIDLNMGLSPFFCDIDADGDLDLILETVSLPIYIYENVGTIYDPIFELLEDMLKDTNGTPIEGTFGDLVDIDEDGDYDFFTGNWYVGTVSFYENIGSPYSYAFSLVTSNFAGINVGEFSYLEFCDIDSDEDHDLFVGGDNGKIWYYQNDSVLPEYTFTCLSTNYLGVDVGDHASPEFCDIDADGDFDLYVGKDNDYDHGTCGDMQFWRNEGNYQNPMFTQENQMYLTFDVSNSCEPDFVDFDNDGDFDMYFLYERLGLMENTGTNDNPSYQVLSLDILGQTFSPSICDFSDLDNDGDEDIVIAFGWSGHLEFWECDGDTSWPGFIEQSSVFIGGLLGAPTLGDIDSDDDLDLLVSGSDGNMVDRLYYYENQGSPARFNFVFIDSNFQDISVDGVVPNLVDFDYDGDLDLMLGGVGYLNAVCTKYGFSISRSIGIG
jgi:hypothetical protein